MIKPDSSNKNKTYLIWLILAIINLVLIILLVDFFMEINNPLRYSSVETTNTPSFSLAQTSPLISQINTKESSDNNPLNKPSDAPILILSVYTNQKSQLYAYQPQQNTFTRVLTGPYEEINPSISPDQKKLAYSAKKNGYWDIYILNLETGLETKVTDTPEYDGAPTWSSDSLFLAYESYKNGNLDIFIQDLQNLAFPPIQLTNSDYPQFSPSWSPQGRKIAFVSTQDGEEEIWIADLDAIDNRFQKVMNLSSQVDLNPHWSTDGEKLLWTTEKDGYPILLQVDFSSENLSVSELGNGEWPNLSGNLLSYIQPEANQNFLIIKKLNGDLLFPSVNLPGSVHGLTMITSIQEKNLLLQNLLNHETLLFSEAVEFDHSVSRNTKEKLTKLDNVEAPFPYLSDAVIEPFNQLRSEISNETGWDLLGQLDKTFVPITEPSAPGMNDDWLYTGRAFEFNPLTIHAGLITTMKEERNGQTYWRIYIKARYQDGSQGRPLKQMPFDLSARYNNDPTTYDLGGSYISIPSGYWIDLTELALGQSWERLPALGTWQKYFYSARFNQFVFKKGLDWNDALMELYPFEAFKTPTSIPTNILTPTPSPTIRYFRSPTITPSPTLTPIPTRRPTWTPYP